MTRYSTSIRNFDGDENWLQSQWVDVDSLLQSGFSGDKSSIALENFRERTVVRHSSSLFIKYN